MPYWAAWGLLILSSTVLAFDNVTESTIEDERPFPSPPTLEPLVVKELVERLTTIKSEVNTSTEAPRATIVDTLARSNPQVAPSGKLEVKPNSNEIQWTTENLHQVVSELMKELRHSKEVMDLVEQHSKQQKQVKPAAALQKPHQNLLSQQQNIADEDYFLVDDGSFMEGLRNESAAKASTVKQILKEIVTNDTMTKLQTTERQPSVSNTRNEVNVSDSKNPLKSIIRPENTVPQPQHVKPSKAPTTSSNKASKTPLNLHTTSEKDNHFNKTEASRRDASDLAHASSAIHKKEQVCSENERWFPCKPCDRCTQILDKVCMKPCQPGCGCIASFRRHPSGKCVRIPLCRPVNRAIHLFQRRLDLNNRLPDVPQRPQKKTAAPEHQTQQPRRSKNPGPQQQGGSEAQQKLREPQRWQQVKSTEKQRPATIISKGIPHSSELNRQRQQHRQIIQTTNQRNVATPAAHHLPQQREQQPKQQLREAQRLPQQRQNHQDQQHQLHQPQHQLPLLKEKKPLPSQAVHLTRSLPKTRIASLQTQPIVQRSFARLMQNQKRVQSPTAKRVPTRQPLPAGVPLPSRESSIMPPVPSTGSEITTSTSANSISRPAFVSQARPRVPQNGRPQTTPMVPSKHYSAPHSGHAEPRRQSLHRGAFTPRARLHSEPQHVLKIADRRLGHAPVNTLNRTQTHAPPHAQKTSSVRGAAPRRSQYRSYSKVSQQGQQRPQHHPGRALGQPLAHSTIVLQSTIHSEPVKIQRTSDPNTNNARQVVGVHEGPNHISFEEAENKPNPNLATSSTLNSHDIAQQLILRRLPDSEVTGAPVRTTVLPLPLLRTTTPEVSRRIANVSEETKDLQPASNGMTAVEVSTRNNNKVPSQFALILQKLAEIDELLKTMKQTSQ